MTELEHLRARVDTLVSELCKARELTEAADRRALAALDFANAAIECIPDGTPIKLLGETALALLKEVDR
jgi:hypothetical protein